MEDFLDDGAPHSSTADDLLDEILPEDLDWQRLVRTYPLPALAVAAAGGFLLGLLHGPTLVAAASSYVAAQVSRQVGQVIGQDLA